MLVLKLLHRIMKEIEYILLQVYLQLRAHMYLNALLVVVIYWEKSFSSI